MMDDETRWQDAALPADQMVGPPRPEDAASGAPMGDESDYDELETGIASIFAAMQAAGGDAPAGASGDDGAEHIDEAASLEDAHTFALLSELDRLWQRPSP